MSTAQVIERGSDPIAKILDRPVSDKRSKERQEFHATIRVAPYNGSTLPRWSAFFEADGRDISTHGISFFVSEAPRSDHLVIVLGSAEQPILMTARVVHCREGYFNRQRKFVVGCQFTGRLGADLPSPGASGSDEEASA